MISLRDIVLFLGRDGAVAGLSASDLTIAELQELVGKDFHASSKIRRDELIVRVVEQVRAEFLKTPEQMMAMDAVELQEYFIVAKYTKAEIIELLEQLDIRPGSASRRNIAEFAAREISDIGMYRRVAKGAAGHKI